MLNRAVLTLTCLWTVHEEYLFQFRELYIQVQVYILRSVFLSFNKAVPSNRSLEFIFLQKYFFLEICKLFKKHGQFLMFQILSWCRVSVQNRNDRF